MNIQPFSINVAQRTLDDVRERLAHTRWPDEVQEADWEYGTNLDYLKGLVAYWQHGPIQTLTLSPNHRRGTNTC